jgi:hypothetical protein
VIIQTLLNLIIFSFFITFSFQAIQTVSKPISIDKLKIEYLQLQIDTLNTYYSGAEIIDNQVCFTDTICITQNNQRLVLTPGYQILIEGIQTFVINKDKEMIIISFSVKNKWQDLYVKSK